MTIHRFREPTMRKPGLPNRSRPGALIIVLLVGACAESDSGGLSGPDFAAHGKGPSVTATSPASGREGEVGLVVSVLGSGYAAGAQAAWERNGVPDPKISVQSTAFISSTELRATISIAPDADIALYDVSVTVNGKKGIGTELFTVTSSTVDPATSWLLPLSGAGLGVQSDGAFPDGSGNSVYADRVCGMAGTIFATTQNSNSGDATMQTASSKSCSRNFRLAYPDGRAESVQFFSNLQLIQSTTSMIPVNTTVRRHLNINTSATRNSRCGTLYFGVGLAGGGIGSDSVMVTRTSAATWHVYSQPAPNTRALCKSTGALYSMPVDFVIRASRDLPAE